MAPAAGLEGEGLSPLVACCHKDTTTFGLRTLASCGKSQVVDLKPEDVVSETIFNTHSLKGLNRSFLLIYCCLYKNPTGNPADLPLGRVP